MKRLLWILLALPVIGLGSCATTDEGYGYGDVNAPPAPAIATEPQWRYVADGLYVPNDNTYDYDMFRVGGVVYLYSNDGYWYRGDADHPHFIATREDRVPRRIFQLSNRDYQWHHQPQAAGPWGHQNRDRDHDNDRDHDHDRDNSWTR